jgi:hypothetical protein
LDWPKYTPSQGSRPQAGLTPSIKDYNKLYDVLGRAKQWPLCKHFYDCMIQQGVMPSKYTYSILVHSAAVAAPWAEV